MSDTDNKKTSINPLHVVVYCGPNGSGKTTMMDHLKRHGLQVNGHPVFPPLDEVNPDRIARSLYNLPQDKRDADAQRKARDLRESFLANRKPFSFETVMSHPSKINELQRLRDADYTVLLTFITTNDPQKNVERVKQRVLTQTTTGHDVPVDRILSRYERTLELLPKAVEVAHASYVFDNSYDNQAPSLQALINGDNIELHDPLETWVKTRLLDPLAHREQELDALEREVAKRGIKLAYPDELKGEYQGTIAFQTAYFLVVYHDDKTLSVHDKLMLNTMKKQAYVVDTPCRIVYDYKTEPRIELFPLPIKVLI